MIKIATRYGHNKNQSGGCTSAHWTGINVRKNNLCSSSAEATRCEYEIIRQYGPSVEKELRRHGIEIINVTPPDNKDSENNNLNAGVNKANELKVDYFISFHANQSDKNGEPQGEGCEVVYSPGNEQGKKLAKSIAAEINKLGYVKRRDEGAYADDRDLCEIRKTAMTSIIIEPLFINSEDDMNRFNETDGGEKLGNAIAKGILNYLNIEYTENNDSSRANENTGVSLIGNTEATLAQMQKWARANNATERFINAAKLYLKYGELLAEAQDNKIGLRADILYCQSAKETGFGTYTGKVDESWNNFAGIKKPGRNDDEPDAHESFESIEDGIIAHFNHLCAYTGLKPLVGNINDGRQKEAQLHGRYNVVLSCDFAGTVKTVEGLTGNYCPIAGYSQDILKLLDALMNTKAEGSSEENQENNDRGGKGMYYSKKFNLYELSQSTALDKFYGEIKFAFTKFGATWSELDISSITGGKSYLDSIYLKKSDNKLNGKVPEIVQDMIYSSFNSKGSSNNFGYRYSYLNKMEWSKIAEDIYFYVMKASFNPYGTSSSYEGILYGVVFIEDDKKVVRRGHYSSYFGVSHSFNLFLKYDTNAQNKDFLFSIIDARNLYGDHTNIQIPSYGNAYIVRLELESVSNNDEKNLMYYVSNDNAFPKYYLNKEIKDIDNTDMKYSLTTERLMCDLFPEFKVNRFNGKVPIYRYWIYYKTLGTRARFKNLYCLPRGYRTLQDIYTVNGEEYVGTFMFDFIAGKNSLLKI